MNNKFLNEHKKTLPKAIVEGIIITTIGYVFGFVTIDILGYEYYKVGLVLLPLTFFIKYLLNKYWVYKSE